MKNLLLSLLAVAILVVWILTAETRDGSKDPRLSWNHGSQTSASGTPGRPPTATGESSEAITLSMADPRLEGCFSGTSRDTSLTRVQLRMIGTPGPGRALRLERIRGGILKVWVIPRQAIQIPGPGSAPSRGYRLPLGTGMTATLIPLAESKGWRIRAEPVLPETVLEPDESCSPSP